MKGKDETKPLLDLAKRHLGSARCVVVNSSQCVLLKRLSLVSLTNSVFEGVIETLNL